MTMDEIDIKFAEVWNNQSKLYTIKHWGDRQAYKKWFRLGFKTNTKLAQMK